jgi:uncharacterized membrane protein
MLLLLPVSYMRLIAASLLSLALTSLAQAHEMEGIDHAHLSNGVVQIIEPIPGMPSTSVAKPSQTGTALAPKASQPNGLVALLIQALLVLSVIVLLVVVLRSSAKQRAQRLASASEHPLNSSTPLPPS